MSNAREFAISFLAAVSAFAHPVNAQSVISTHSGIIHFFEGTVFLGDQPLEPRLGRYPSVPQGAELRTAEGRAEVLLTPGVFLRMGERSAIRMVATDLVDTQVELRAGSIIVDSEEPNPGTSVTLLYKDWKIHFTHKGTFRIDTDPPHLSVRQGEAEVFARSASDPVAVTAGMSLPFAAVLVPDQSTADSYDAFSDWSNGRGKSITADNAISAQLDQDPSTRPPGLDTFTSFPLLGVLPPVSSAYSSYTYSSPYQSGFNSIYYPGYTYPPTVLGFGGYGLGTYRPYTPTYTPGRTGGSPGTGVSLYRPPTPVRIPVPSSPRPVLGSPHIGVHVGGHR